MSKATEGEEMIPLSRVLAMLHHFPLDGLRKASKAFALTLSPEQGDEKEAILAALKQGLLEDSLSYKKEAIDAEPMWLECKGFDALPVTKRGDSLPLLDQETKRELSLLIKRIIEKAGGIDAIDRICAGKVSKDTKKPEQSGFKMRWTGRYGQPEFHYTMMRRLYADTSTGSDYKQRDATALEVEKHAFEVLRQLFGVRADEVIEFSDEAGRQNTGKSYGPQWQVFVYLALRLK